MVNAGVVLLIILTLILTIGIVSVLIVVALESSKSQGNTGGTGAISLPLCSQTVDIDTLLQIPELGADCVYKGKTGQYFYIGNLGTGTYDYVVAPFPTQPFDVCVGFCTQGVSGGICSGANYNGKSAQTNFDNCLKQLSSNNCIPPIPIAAKGAFLYYAISPTCNICSNCG